MTDIDNSMNIQELGDEALEQVAGGKGSVVTATGDVNVREKPNKSSRVLGSLAKGSTWSYLGDKKKDDRGVTWYKINFNGNQGWVSSKYSKLG